MFTDDVPIITHEGRRVRSHQQVAAVEFTDLLKQWKEVVLPSRMQREFRFVQKHELLGLGIKDQQAQ